MLSISFVILAFFRYLVVVILGIFRVIGIPSRRRQMRRRWPAQPWPCGPRWVEHFGVFFLNPWSKIYELLLAHAVRTSKLKHTWLCHIWFWSQFFSSLFMGICVKITNFPLYTTIAYSRHWLSQSVKIVPQIPKS